MLKEFFVPKDYSKQVLQFVQQNRTSPHVSRGVRLYLDKVFPNRWIGKDNAHQLSTIHSPLNVFLCGYVKNNIYKSSICNLDELKIKIIENISSVRCFFLRMH